MGPPQIHLKDVEIIGGVACLRNQNVMVMGGFVSSLHKLHRLRFYEELDRRMELEESEAQVRLVRLISPS